MQHLKGKMQKGLLAMLAGLGLLASACGNDTSQQQDAVAQGDAHVEEGKAIFRQSCTTCHMLKTDATGPALQGVLKRWDGDSVALRAYIRNPAASIEAKEPHALKAWEQFKPTVMPAFPQLTDEQLNSLIAYFQGGA